MTEPDPHAPPADEETTVLGRPEAGLPHPPGPTTGLLGHYDVQETLGQGGFGVVVKAFDRKLRRVVAIKRMRAELAATSPARKRFVREARAAAAVRHENVVQIYAVAGGPVPYLVMEYVPGQSLQHYLDETGPLDAAEVVRIGAQVARGLAAAHATGLIHRDIKPANILLEWADGPRVKLTDFGLARAADDASLTQSGMVVGTPLYMAPEQARGEPTDHRADLYSLGSVLYTMATGRPPFRAPNTLAVLQRVAGEVPRPIREVVPETPDWLCAVIGRLQARRPRDRFQTAAEVADLLERCGADGGRAAARLAPRGPRRRWARRLAGAALGAGLGLGASGYYRQASGPSEPPDPPPWAAAAPSDRPPVPPPAAPPPAARPPAPAAESLWAEVVADLRRRNPQYQGAVVPTVRDGRVVGVEIREARQVKDITPLGRLRDLERLTAPGAGFPDLGPLRGLPLRSVNFQNSTTVRDLGPLAGLPLEDINLWAFQGTDLSPLKGMPLRHLNCGGGGNRLNLAPLRGLPLTDLWLSNTRVDDLAPLAGMPLEALSVLQTPVRDLSPLRGMKLKVLNVAGTRVTDLSVLHGMPLEVLTLDLDPGRDADLLRSLGTLQKVNGKPADAVRAALPPPAGPAAVTPQGVCDDVAAELRRLNPKFRGPIEPEVAGGRVVGLEVRGADQLRDASPLARFPDLIWLSAPGAGFADLRPLRAAVRLRHLHLTNTSVVRDFGPLAGMKLETLMAWGFAGDDLSPLKGMPLKDLSCGGGGKRLDLAPLKGMPLKSLSLNATRVDDLSPLQGMPLEMLHVRETKVRDLSPLRGMRLKQLNINEVRVTDLSPLRGMPLEVVNLDYDPGRDAEVLRSITTLKQINHKPAADFWAGVGGK